MSELDSLKETILKDAPRFTENDRFKFSCHEGLSCFTQCCANVAIFLTPYDILRMKSRLKISSDEFLAKYTVVPFNKKQRLPLVILKMGDDEHKRCLFVSPKGCTIYEDRPWSCRMYPLGLASPKSESAACDEEFYFLMEEEHCRGFCEQKEWTVRKWLEDECIVEYNKMAGSFKEITLHDYL
ncbi:MAG: YkgJ family cysteine cluster protein, partial [Candidatus Lindowbacteria bacterium]|nr:YkgJ family cysteine cluster protein [Candidatus Lindowbacteria bacterium]